MDPFELFEGDVGIDDVIFAPLEEHGHPDDDAHEGFVHQMGASDGRRVGPSSHRGPNAVGGAARRPSQRVYYGAGTSPKRDRNSCADGVSIR
jgi:hypothetical protein